jgi:hypothetical protein
VGDNVNILYKHKNIPLVVKTVKFPLFAYCTPAKVGTGDNSALVKAVVV